MPRVYPSRIECICLLCGKQFTLPPNAIAHGQGKYCSRACLYEARRNRVERTCETCGKKFKVKASTINHTAAKYCSSACYEVARACTQKPCEYCGEMFTAKPSQLEIGHAKYCSAACRSTAMGLNRRADKHPLWLGGSGTYRGNNWQTQRLLALARDGYRCQICKRKRRKGEKQLPVHHIRPYREFASWQEANVLSNLITLCHSCHPKAEHGNLLVPKYLL